MKLHKTVILCATIAILAIPVTLLFTNPETEPTHPSSTSTPTTAADSTAAAAMKTAYQNNLSQLKQTAETGNKQINQLRKNKADTPEINTEYVELTQTIEQFSTGETIDDFHEDILNHTNHDPATLINDMDIITREAITDFTENMKTWTTAVDAENSRIGKLVDGGNETDEARILRLQTEMGLVFKTTIKECTEDPQAAWGCYNAGDDFYSISPSGLTVDDCHLRTTLAHEYRHYKQWEEGYMTGDNIQTREWLEADARDWQWHGGGCW